MKIHGGETAGSENEASHFLRPETKKTVTRALAKKEVKGNPSASNEIREIAISGKQRENIQEETLVVSATIAVNVE